MTPPEDLDPLQQKIYTHLYTHRCKLEEHDLINVTSESKPHLPPTTHVKLRT
jgi:hypothetical protein